MENVEYCKVKFTMPSIDPQPEFPNEYLSFLQQRQILLFLRLCCIVSETFKLEKPSIERTIQVLWKQLRVSRYESDPVDALC